MVLKSSLGKLFVESTRDVGVLAQGVFPCVLRE